MAGVEIDGGTTRRVPKNPDLRGLSSIAWELLAHHGWLLILFALVVALLNQIRQRRRRRENSEADITEEDPLLVVRRQEGLESARRKMQEQQNARAAEYREKKREEDERRRNERVESWEKLQRGESSRGGKGAADVTGDATVSPPKTEKKPLRATDYSPLSGSGGSCSWRPGRRGPSGG